MATYSIDTAAAIKRMMDSGMSEKQAEAVVDTFREQEREVVTQDRLRAELNALLVKIITSQVAVAALLFAALKYFS